MQEQIGSSLHGLPATRWTARVNSVRPFSAHLPGIRMALEKFLPLSLTPKTRTEVNGAITYVSSFTCIVMSSIWLKILVVIDQRSQVIQARDATIDVEVSNVKSLLNDLKDLRAKWSSIVKELKFVAEFLQSSQRSESAGEGHSSTGDLTTRQLRTRMMKMETRKKRSSVICFMSLLIPLLLVLQIVTKLQIVLTNFRASCGSNLSYPKRKFHKRVKHLSENTPVTFPKRN